ncbi:hypothetical protein MBM_03618 [Drepanopeziza brunnea f. sp. 'multigermtubi' MB_m1]|uniref:Nonsense-mediated mRNA decay factor n=1 Tax=Marssonina brunnea f. sp. multigermtubi (strain MB_m1) TaxID=1072389 RepID=K1WXS9_MARBU|nr:uncharacterized protein MBM_03618 [Drepanopeziza brunnea f. sp. 'multigermtubi' MB_m1]EKD17846.1 hypothetical protein MBM_03618 [Drepanopeziza brunnea f. sp. 'multigermtubi' MB_m1]
MDSSPAAQSWALVQQLEAQIKGLMKNRDPTYKEIDNGMVELRTACEAVQFADFSFATSVEVEQRLWSVHTMINNRYRKVMEHSKKANKTHVERRATAKHYADFIKTSQYFYKGYIQRLASHFDGLENLYRIASRLSLSTLTADQRVKVSPDIRPLIELSCHATLLHLGDLSRWRNSFRTKDRSWEPAMGYYALANDLRPTDGAAHSQMSVIALSEQNHLDAIYHLYRALTTENPHALAKGNLETEFKKIISAWEKKVPQQNNDKLRMLCWWYVLLQAKFYQGVEFAATQKELEREILSRLALLLKGQSFGATLEKLVIVNIAAQHFAYARFQQATETSQEVPLNSYNFCIRFNVRFFTVLLQTLLPELEDEPTGEDIPNGPSGSRSERENDKITAIARRVLPAIRQYSTWVMANNKWLMALSAPVVASNAIAIQINEMWKAFANVSTRLGERFSGNQASVGYLLEEDESTVGFEPLRSFKFPQGCDVFKNIAGESKPRNSDQGINRHHPSVEMQSRIQDILCISLTFHMQPQFPITLSQSNGRNVFHFVEGVASPPNTAESSVFPTPTPTQTSKSAFSPRELDGSHHSGVRDAVSTYDAHHSMENDMLRMVDGLVDSSASGTVHANDETSYGMGSRTANEIFALTGSNGYDWQVRSSPKMLPSMPGFQDSAFAPQPNELKLTSPMRYSYSPAPLATREQQLEAAAALEVATGYSSCRTTSWGRQSSLVGSTGAYKSVSRQLDEGLDERIANTTWARQRPRPASGSVAQSVNQLLQESLNQQYMSSGFSDSSSIYVNTPPPVRNGVMGVRNGMFGMVNADSAIYAGASAFDRDTMLQSSIWTGSQQFGGYSQTPPGGQGG